MKYLKTYRLFESLQPYKPRLSPKLEVSFAAFDTPGSVKIPISKDSLDHWQELKLTVGDILIDLEDIGIECKVGDIVKNGMIEGFCIKMKSSNRFKREDRKEIINMTINRINKFLFDYNMKLSGESIPSKRHGSDIWEKSLYFKSLYQG